MTHLRVSQDAAATLGRIGCRALAMLPQDVQAAVESSLGTVRRASAESRPELRQGAAPLDPPYVFVVRAEHSPTFTSLRRLSWVRPDLLGVVFDRRWMGQRRVRNESFSTERRRGERRQSEPNWTRSGFLLTSPTSAASPALWPGEAPARLGSFPMAPVVSSPKTASRRGVSARERSGVAPRNPGRRWRIAALGIGIGLLLAVASAAGVYLRWQNGHLRGIEGIVSGSLASTRSKSPAGRVPSEPSPARAPRSPTAARFEPGTPAPPGAPRPSPAPTLVLAAPVVPPPPTGVISRSAAEITASAGVAIERCVAPAERTLAMRGGEVLGALVNARIDASAQPPRCLFVIERPDGTLWVVDSSRVEARRQ